MPIRKLVEFLDRNKVKYSKIEHSNAVTAQEVAESAQIPGKELAKVVMVLLDDKLSMAVLPASFHVDLARLRELSNSYKAALASEAEFRQAFPECEVGAMPPFGNLWDIPVYVASVLAEDEMISFNAGTHRQLVRLSYDDFERLVEPQVLDFTTVLA